MKFSILVFLSTVILKAAPLKTDFFKEKSKLVLVVVVDQLRADYLTRFRSRFLPAKRKDGEVGGFEYLMSQGAYFPFGSYDALQNMTGPGHATILTGAYPHQTGIALNTWFDSKVGRLVYCAQDESKKTVGAQGKKDWGTSPRNLWANTYGDELKNAGYASKVISISLKDRSAIMMGGHRADAAFWFDSASFHWVSSQYYFPNDKLPTWVDELNKSIDLKKGESRSKESLASPQGNELTVNAIEKILAAYRLGQGKETDMLAVSFSSHDYLGHSFGPNSKEMEEMTLADDLSISKLLNLVRKNVPGGLKSVTVVLTADHGVAPVPEFLKKEKMPAGRIDEEELRKALNAHLIEKLGSAAQGDWVEAIIDLNVFFNPKANTNEEKRVPKAQLEELVKNFLLKWEGVSQAFTFSDFMNRKLPPGMFERQILKSYIPQRSGDVVGILKPFFIAGNSPTTHMTGYSYDRQVPIIFVGPKFRPGIYAEGAEVVDIAPTLSFLSGVIAPAVSEGKVLSQILQ